MTQHPAPTCTVNPRGAKRLRSGLPWVYRQDILSPAQAEGGSIVRVVDEKGNLIGHAFWAEKSAVAIRLLTRGHEPCNEDTLRRRIGQALTRRQKLFPHDNAFRVIHGEADLLPGLFADRYGDGLAVQLLSEGAEKHKDILLDELKRLLGPRVMALRNDTSAREFEFLPRENQLLFGEDTRCEYREGQNTFEVDLMQERKTGGFLDQRENHVRAAEYARGEGLDTFCYHGGFALALARGCTSVLALDQDENAAATATKNAERNGLSNVKVEVQNAFAKRKEGIPAAQRAYRELNLRALKLLKPGGILISCSCSGKITTAMFEEIILGAAEDVKRPVQILERRGPGRDHPGLLGVAETEYLKCFILQAVET